MRILITGSSGQLGHELGEAFRPFGTLLTPGRSECDLSSPQNLRGLVREAAPDLILSSAAYTDVNGAESDRETAFAVNAEAPQVFAEEAKRLGALLIHFSTDYVFAGDKAGPYVESDPTGPLNVYGATKLAGEQAIGASGCRHFIFRTSWVYSARGKNFVRTMLALGQKRESLSIVDDQLGGPTSAGQLAEAVSRIVASEEAGRGVDAPSGVYHLTARGAVSWCGFAQRIFEQADSRAGLIVSKVAPVASDAFPSPAKRPLNSVLSNTKFGETFGFTLGDWTGALDRVLDELGVGRVGAAAG